MAPTGEPRKPLFLPTMMIIALAGLSRPPAAGAADEDRAAHDQVDAVLASGRQTEVRALVNQLPQALAAATPRQKADLITVLQRGSTGKADEQAILAILEATTVVERAVVLRLIDAGGDKYDVEELVFHDVDDPAIRQQLLDLIQAQNVGAGPAAPGVISDFDDTAVPHKHRPHGRGAPGMAELYRALAGRAGGAIHFVTARPQAVGRKVRAELDKRGFPSGAVKFGHARRVVFGGADGIIASKLTNIGRLLALHPQQRFILFGDTVQHDPEVYRETVRRHPDQIAAVVIFNATGLDPGHPRGHGFILANNSVHAAMELAKRGFLSADDVGGIAVAAREQGLPDGPSPLDSQ